MNSDQLALAGALIALVSLLISVVSLLTTTFCAIWGWRYTRRQISQTDEQMAEGKREFLASVIPSMFVEVYCEPKPNRAVYMRVRHHEAAATVTILSAIASVDSPSGNETFKLTFVTEPEDLQPKEVIAFKSRETLDEVISSYFPTYSQSACPDIWPKPSGAANTDPFRLKLRYSFLPGYFEATPVEIVREFVFEVRREPSSQASK